MGHGWAVPSRALPWSDLAALVVLEGSDVQAEPSRRDLERRVVSRATGPLAVVTEPISGGALRREGAGVVLPAQAP